MRSGVRVRRIDRRRCRAVAAAIALLAIGRVIGWNPAWRAFGVTPLQPPFFDMHVINDYAACAWKGVEPSVVPLGYPFGGPPAGQFVACYAALMMGNRPLVIGVGAAAGEQHLPPSSNLRYDSNMGSSKKRVILKRRGRPATGNDPVRAFRMSDEFMVRIDAWSADQEDRPSRAEAIRRLVELGLKAKSK